MQGDARVFVRGNKYKWVALVVAQQNVVARPEGLDEVVFEQQRLVLGMGHRHLHAGHALQHRLGARVVRTTGEITGDPLAQVARLAYVQHRTFGIQHAVDAGRAAQVLDEDFRIESRHVAGVSSCCARATTWSNMTGVSRRV